MMNKLIAQKLKRNLRPEELRIIMSSFVPEYAREEIVELIDAGEKITEQIIKRTIDDYRSLEMLKFQFLGRPDQKIIKVLRQNSKKYYRSVIERSIHKCEICGWGNERLNCLQIHHIIPVINYHEDCFKRGRVPSKDYELANLSALCPNCHSFVHIYFKGVNQQHRDRIFKTFMSLYGQEESIQSFVNITTTKTFHDRFPLSASIFEDGE